MGIFSKLFTGSSTPKEPVPEPPPSKPTETVQAKAKSNGEAHGSVARIEPAVEPQPTAGRGATQRIDVPPAGFHRASPDDAAATAAPTPPAPKPQATPAKPDLEVSSKLFQGPEPELKATIQAKPRAAASVPPAPPETSSATPPLPSPPRSNEESAKGPQPVDTDDTTQPMVVPRPGSLASPSKFRPPTRSSKARTAKSATTSRQSPRPSPAPFKPPVQAKPANPPDAFSRDVDALFDDATVSSTALAGPGTLPTPADTQKELHELFGQIAAHHTLQIRDFMVELTLTSVSKQWAHVCAPALESIRKAAEDIGYTKLFRALRDFERALDDARRGSGGLITEGARARLLDTFAALSKLLPEAFDVQGHRARRDPLIVELLLDSVPGLSTLARERLYAVGLSKLEAFYAATPVDMAAAAGIDEGTSRRVVERFGAYRAGRAERAEHAGHEAERAHLRELLTRLEQRQTEFRDAERKEDLRRKRRLRDQRTELVIDIQLALAHLGDVDLVKEISRKPVDAKIDRVGRFLQQATGG